MNRRHHEQVFSAEPNEHPIAQRATIPYRNSFLHQVIVYSLFIVPAFVASSLNFGGQQRANELQIVFLAFMLIPVMVIALDGISSRIFARDQRQPVLEVLSDKTFRNLQNDHYCGVSYSSKVVRLHQDTAWDTRFLRISETMFHFLGHKSTFVLRPQDIAEIEITSFPNGLVRTYDLRVKWQSESGDYGWVAIEDREAMNARAEMRTYEHWYQQLEKLKNSPPDPSPPNLPPSEAEIGLKYRLEPAYESAKTNLTYFGIALGFFVVCVALMAAYPDFRGAVVMVLTLIACYAVPTIPNWKNLREDFAARKQKDSME